MFPRGVERRQTTFQKDSSLAPWAEAATNHAGALLPPNRAPQGSPAEPCPGRPSPSPARLDGHAKCNVDEPRTLVRAPQK